MSNKRIDLLPTMIVDANVLSTIAISTDSGMCSSECSVCVPNGKLYVDVYAYSDIDPGPGGIGID